MTFTEEVPRQRSNYEYKYVDSDLLLKSIQDEITDERDAERCTRNSERSERYSIRHLDDKRHQYFDYVYFASYC